MRKTALCGVLILTLFAGVVAGCSRKGNESGGAGIIGLWEIETYKVNGVKDRTSRGSYYEFRADHTCYYGQRGDDRAWVLIGDWSLNGDQLTLDAWGLTTTYTATITNSSLTIEGMLGRDRIEMWLLRVY